MSDLSAQRLPVIRCAMCHKPVDRIFVDHNEHMMVIDITVWCHGDTDKMQLTQKFMAEIGREGEQQIFTRGGVAFQSKLLTEAPKELRHA
ncbi:hypothetical protein [Rhizobium sp. 18065]|uniref:hypothetical protein n=1 Tax=Rhizobium sp. 18065 TaxID=2681411 RepID=UPI001358FAFB|nr:hypothetical protein [Rhizobium sp. 18065]